LLQIDVDAVRIFYAAGGEVDRLREPDIDLRTIWLRSGFDPP
jgi:hypothetical protein